jgi:hypothetical protein
MAGLAIQATDERAVPGNLHARVSGDKLLMPREIADAFKADGLRTAEDLISYIQAFPSAVAAKLSWSSRDVQKATARLRTQLRGKVDARLLQPQRRPSPPLGALDPDQLP